MHKELKNHLIVKYRESISERYNYDQIKDDPKLPDFFDRKTVGELKKFFLTNLYSDPVHREQLDAAFAQLESYVAHPSKIWGLMGNITSAILKFGFHFPAAIKAALSALETHSAARHFEDAMLNAAIERKFTVPLTDKQFRECLAAIPLKQAEGFIEDITALFNVISDQELLEKTILIMRDVLRRMGEKKDVYTSDDTDAIELGIEIFDGGYKLLEKFDDDMKQQLVSYITYTETKFLKGLHKKKK